MTRAAVLVGLFLVWLALGPWVLVLALASLAVPRVRDRVRPERPWRDLGIGAGAAGVLAALVVVVPDGWLPVPPGSGLLVTPSYVGRPAIVRPVRGLEVPQHPRLAPDGTSSVQGDGWATGTYRWDGPLGESPEVDTAWFGTERCGSLALDSRDRLVALCTAGDAARLRVLDPGSMRPLVTTELPDRTATDDAAAGRLCASALHLDDAGRAVLATGDRRVWVFDTADAAGDPDLTLAEELDLTEVVTADDCVVALAPDWAGRLWFATYDGVVGTVAPGTGVATATDLGEQVANPMAVDRDGVHLVTTEALYRLEAGGDGRPVVSWRSEYDRGNGRKPGQLSPGSGTGPTLLPGGLVAIADNANPRTNVVVLDRGTGAEVCRVGVFEDDAGATESALVAVGDGVVVTNNRGYTGPLRTVLGRATEPGLARVDVLEDRCRVGWTSDLVVPSSAPKVSLPAGLLYAYTKRPTWWGASAWYLSALDVHTGRHVFSVRTGTGVLADNDRAPVVLARNGSAYVATLGGLVRVHDRVIDP